MQLFRRVGAVLPTLQNEGNYAIELTGTVTCGLLTRFPLIQKIVQKQVLLVEIVASFKLTGVLRVLGLEDFRI